MTRIRRGSAFLLKCVAATCTLAALGAVAPASASDGDDALAKMQAALRSASSFTVRYEPTIPMSWVVVQPDRIRRVMPSSGGSSIEDWIVIGRQSYTRDGDKPWKLGRESVNGIRWDEIAAFLRDGTTAHALADRIEDGTPAGALDVLIPEYPLGNGRSSRAFHMTCSYDKTTYFPRACWYQTVAKIWVTTTYEHRNDPSNAIEPPPGLGVPVPSPLP